MKEFFLAVIRNSYLKLQNALSSSRAELINIKLSNLENEQICYNP